MLSNIATLKSLCDVSIKLLGHYISKNKFESEDEESYKFIEENTKLFDTGLFPILQTSLAKLLETPRAYDKSKKEVYLSQLELINLAILAYNVVKGNEYETCANNFFRSIMNEKDELTEGEIEFYVKLRHMALATYLKEIEKDENVTKETIDLFFPSEPTKLFFENEEFNIEVIASVNVYRDKLINQSKDEITDILNHSDVIVNLLQDFVSNRYGTLTRKLGAALKRPNEEESNVQKKPKKSKTVIATPNINESEKAKNAQLINEGTPGRRLNKDEVIPTNNADDVMDKGEENPISDTNDSGHSEEQEVTPTNNADDVMDRGEENPISDTNDSGSEEEATPANEKEVEDHNDGDDTDNEAGPSQLFSRSVDKRIIVHRKVRKMNERWTEEEVIALEDGLKYFRRPAWNYIVAHAYPVLDKRTGGNLKDKARTMIRDLKRRGCKEPDEFGPYKYVKNQDGRDKYNTRMPKPKPKE